MARPSLERNPKFRELAYRLDLPRPYVLGLLEMLWGVANECGDPVIGAPLAVEAAAEWPGERGVFFEALREGRWLDEVEPGKWEVHDYWDHAPDYVKKRLQRETQRRTRGKALRDESRKRRTDRSASGRRPVIDRTADAEDRSAVTERPHSPLPSPAPNAPVEDNPLVGPVPEPTTRTEVRAARSAVWNAYLEAHAAHYSSRNGQRPPPPLLDDVRHKLIDARLAKYPVDEVVDAVRGIFCSPYHCGENDSGTRYLTLELALRITRHQNNVEKFRDLYRSKNQKARLSGLQPGVRDAAGRVYTEEGTWIDPTPS